MDELYGDFVWDSAKNRTNLVVHGVDFITAAEVFRDPNKIISIDTGHSKIEDRLFCMGQVAGRIMTVRFVYRQDRIRIIGAGFWRKGRRLYEKENK